MYGTGTRSYNRSPEARDNKRQQKAVTKAYVEAKERGEVKETILTPLCHCASWYYSHELDAHKQLKTDYDWPTPEQRLARLANIEFWERPL
jgi:hypothetical protein